jgi:Amt family ammonium transporter
VRWRALVAGAILAASAAQASAQADAGGVSAGDTAWLLASAALVMMMTAPGVAFFYGGLVSQRNMLATLMQSFFLLCLIGVQWVAFGYSLAFGSDHGGWIGGLELSFFGGVGQQPLSGHTVPHLAFAAYQGMFAVITPALIAGAFAERLRFSAFLLFSLLWATFVYDPLCHWVWGGGWLGKMGVLDFAGGTVVHVSSGVSALVAALVVGRRSGYPQRVSPPHSLTLTLLGGAFLWFGWFGFNAGSALAASGLAASAFVATHTAAASAGLTWTLVEWAHRGKPTVLGVVTAVVAGLVSITPAAGFVTPASAMLIGIGATAACYFGINVLKPRFGYDDSLDVFGVHGLGGTWGALATGLFASKAVNPAGADGLLHGNAGLLLTQSIGVATGWAIAALGTFVTLKLVALVTPLRVTEEQEILGLDLSQHGEAAYSILGSAAMPASSVGAPYYERARPDQAPSAVSRG